MSDTKKRQKKNKKDSQLVIRIKGEDRDAFVSLCEDLDTSAAREIRRFIRKFVTTHSVQEPAEEILPNKEVAS
ncbi:MAG: hypothetical protein GW875_07730 [Deltaproteobacteria bacterium]|nr:hypothetical protein [Deltaproteobacteria bacterium]NCP02964.1 hypothetical protein [Deltaproteobacteria bacterium]